MTKLENNKIEFETRMASFTIVAEDIGMISYKGNTDVSAQEMEEFCEIMYKIMGYKKIYLINVVKSLGSFPNEVWEFLGTNVLHNNMILGSSLVTTALGYVLQTKFFFQKYPLKYPVELVKTKEDALEWIAELKEKNG